MAGRPALFPELPTRRPSPGAVVAKDEVAFKIYVIILSGYLDKSAGLKRDVTNEKQFFFSIFQRKQAKN